MKGLIFTYLLTYGGAVASLIKPYYGLLIYVCFAILKPDALWEWAVPRGNYSRIIACAMLVGWVLNGTGTWKWGKGAAIAYALIGYWVWTIISAVFAPDSDVAMRIVEELTKIVLPFIVGLTLIDTVGKLKQLGWVILVSQGYVALELNQLYYDGYGKVIEEYGFGGLGRAMLGCGLVCCVWLGFFLMMSEKAMWKRAVAMICMIVICHAIVITFSRGALLGLITSGLTAFLLIKKTFKHYVCFIVMTLVCIRMVGPEVQKRFATTFAASDEREASAQSRIELWGNCITLMKENPILGVGPGHFLLNSRRFGWDKAKEGHSTWLQTGAELGVPGLIVFCSIYGVTFWRLFALAKVKNRVVDPWIGTAARSVLAGLVGFAASATFVTVDRVEIVYSMMLLGAAALKLQSQGCTDGEGASETSDLALNGEGALHRQETMILGREPR